jgi:hypothetical protein
MATLVAAPVAAQTVTAGDVTLRLSGRMHFQFNTTSVRAGDLAEPGEVASVAGTTFETRRVRMMVQVTIKDWITGYVEPDFGLARLTLKQVWMNFGFSDAFQVRIGQFKKPFSQIQLTSSLQTATIERSLRIRNLAEAYENLDDASGAPALTRFRGDVVLGEEQEILDRFGYVGYDMGVAAHGKLGVFGYDVGAFNGAGPDTRDDTDGKAIAGRLTWTAPLETPLTLGAAASYSEIAATAAHVADGTAWSLDLELGAFRRTGLHLLAEIARGDNLATDHPFVAGQAIASWFVPRRNPRFDGLELVARASWGDPDRETDGDHGTLLSPGVNVYFDSKNRFMLNWDVFAPGGDRFQTRYALRAQAQLHW